MADWLIFLFELGGNVALLAFAVFLLGKWLWHKINAAMDSYTTAYTQEAARIDARIGHLEKLAEEQARLTRTVESIKDEIGAQRKSHDNRWEFRKELYCNMVKSTYMVMYGYARISQSQPLLKHENPATRAWAEQMFKDAQADLRLHGPEFMTNAVLAPLALADDVAPAVADAYSHTYQSVVLNGVDIDTKLLQIEIDRLNALFGKLIQAGRNDLWGTPKSEAKAEEATQT
jgi:hypothetical protein